jgi:hypothetical protein
MKAELLVPEIESSRPRYWEQLSGLADGRRIDRMAGVSGFKLQLTRNISLPSFEWTVRPIVRFGYCEPTASDLRPNAGL